MAVFTDPEGAAFRVWQAKRQATSGAAPEGFADMVSTLTPIAEDQFHTSANWTVTLAVDDADATAERAGSTASRVYEPRSSSQGGRDAIDARRRRPPQRVHRPRHARRAALKRTSEALAGSQERPQMGMRSSAAALARSLAAAAGPSHPSVDERGSESESAGPARATRRPGRGQPATPDQNTSSILHIGRSSVRCSTERDWRFPWESLV
jgi:hypothetical protein